MKAFSICLALAASSVAFGQSIPYPGNDADNGVSRPHGVMDLYTGNVGFAVHDLSVSGAVGKFKLSWTRHATSRTAQTTALFGYGHNWIHNWQWEMADAGQDDQGRAVIEVNEPEGQVYRFTQTSPGQWWPAPSVKDRVSSDGSNFRLVREDGSEVDFVQSATAQGNSYIPTQILDSAGDKWTLTWNNGLLVTVAEPAGRTLTISYSSLTAPNAASGATPYTVISQVSGSNNQSITYSYAFPDGVDYPVLSATNYADGTTSNYSYVATRPNSRVLLTQAADPHAEPITRGRSFTYRSEPEAAQGQIAAIQTTNGSVVMNALTADTKGVRNYAATQVNGAIVYRSYNPGGNVEQEIDEVGYTTANEYDAGGRGFRISKTDALGRRTTFQNDNAGRILKQTYADGNSITLQRDVQGRITTKIDELGNKTVIGYDASGRLVRAQLADGEVVEAAYNALGQPVAIKAANGAKTSIVYDERGLKTKVTDGLGNTKTYAYDAAGRVNSVVDALGHAITFERDLAGRVVKRTYADGAITSASYNEFGQLTKQSDPLGANKTFVYDEFGRLSSMFNALGAETRLEYGAIGQSGVVFNYPTQITDPVGRKVAICYDAKGRVVSRTIGAGSLEARTVRYSYDAENHPTSITDGAGNTTQYFYDLRGHRSKVVNATQQTFRTYTHDAVGRQLTMTTSTGEVFSRAYDSVGHILSTTNPLGNSTKNTINSAGQLIAMTDAKGNTYRYEYDALGRKTAMIYPDGTKETTSYDSLGRIVATTNRVGVSRSFSYDIRNREILSTWSDGSVAPLSKSYDLAGRLVSEDNGISRLTFAYDTSGRLISETQDISGTITGGNAPGPQKISYAYDSSNRRSALTYPDGTTINYIYDQTGNLKTLSENNEISIIGYKYDDAGNVIEADRDDQSDTIYAYDELNRVTEILDENPIGNVVSKEDYAYNDADQRASTTRVLNPNGVGNDDEVLRDTYYYDEDNQVAGADYGARVDKHGGVGKPAHMERINYDAVGNRVQAVRDGKVTNYVANALNEYVRIGDKTIVYDGAGNMLSTGEWNYQYDALNRMVAATNGSMVAKFYYDAKNRCVARSYNGAVTLNYYDDWNLIEEHDAAGHVVARNVFGRRKDEVVAVVNKYGTFHPHYDVLGSVSFLTDATGKLVERYTYSVSGEVSVSDSEGKRLMLGDGLFSRSRVGNRWMYAGREWLAEIGMYDYRNRIYSAEMGRFVQTDPIRFAGGDINLYRYVDNAFLKHIDPQGEASSAVTWGAAGALLGGGATAILSIVVDAATGGLNIAATPAEIGAGAAAGAAAGVYAGKVWDNIVNMIGGKGERGWAGSSSGTDNPYKHAKPHPTDPTKIIVKDPQTGKKIVKPKPADFPSK